MNLYPDIVHENDLSPDAFGDEVDEACNAIYKACKGWGTDEKGLIKALASQNGEQRTKIAMRYEEIYDQNLSKLVKSEVGGDLGKALYYLSCKPHEAEAKMIHHACKGLGTNELVLYPIVIGRTNAEIDILKKTYFNMYSKDLGGVLASELSGALEQIIFNCLQGVEEEYDPEYHNEEKVKEDVDIIYACGQGKFGTDEKNFFKKLCALPPEHLKNVNLAYAEEHGYTLLKAVEEELSGTVQDAALFMLGMKLKPYETVAALIKKACAGFGTNELLLTTCLIRYAEIMPDVDIAHIEKYEKSVRDRVKDETRGKFETVLLEIIDTAILG